MTASRHSRRMLLAPALLVLLAAVPAGCGGDSAAPAPGSPENPLVAQTSSAREPSGRRHEARAPRAQKAGRRSGYERLLEQQSRTPRSRFTPCNLVTAREARRVLGTRIEQPFEAPLGPTCIYRSADGRRFVTLAVQALDFSKVKPQLRQRRRFDVAGRAAYCGHFGQDVLYVPLARRRALTVTARCDTARRFAATAVRRLAR